MGLARLPPLLRNLSAALILSPLIVPVIVVAIGIYYAYSRYGLVGTPVGLVLAHTCLAVPFVVTSVSASLAGFDRRLEQAALSLGATPWGTFRQVTLPLIRPGVLVGALFAFITSFDELVVALFLSGSGAVTLPRRMWDDLRFAHRSDDRRGVDANDRADRGAAGRGLPGAAARRTNTNDIGGIMLLRAGGFAKLVQRSCAGDHRA